MGAVTGRQRLLAVARGDEPADLVVRDARVFSVFTREWLEGDVAVADGRFAGIDSYAGEETLDARGSMLVPGFIDAHVHIESSMLTLERFAEVVLATGTTTIVADPHELANVVGSRGVHWLLDAAEHVPLNVFVMAPSCVPASKFESPRGPLDLEEMEGILRREGALGVAEMMDFPAHRRRLLRAPEGRCPRRQSRRRPRAGRQRARVECLPRRRHHLGP